MSTGLNLFIQKIRVTPGISVWMIVAYFLLLQLNSVQATHIVGGSMTYRNLGNNNIEVTIILRRDCYNGAPDAPFDSLAYLGVFYTDFQKAFRVGADGVLKLPLLRNDTIPGSIDDVCLGGFQPVCVHQALYRDTIRLSRNDDGRGYILAYQRCCRNKTLTNIIDPLETGSTYTVVITDDDLKTQNSSPKFGDFPPLYICSNKPFTFDHHVIDINGDSLVYSFCTPYKGKTKAEPAGRPDFPPFDTVQWLSPYSLNNLMGSNLSINSSTGEINVTPRIVGQFLIGICVSEYRNGKLLSITRRDFELNVVPCGIKPNAQIQRTSLLCDGLSVSFKNLSNNGIDFIWYFDWKNNKNLTSTDFNPTFNYSKPGEYQVLLFAQNGSCSDTTSIIIKVIDPQLKADFNFKVDCKDHASFEITNLSTANSVIQSYQWILQGPKDTLKSILKDPLFTLSGDGLITIKLTITDTNGCTSVISKMQEINLIDVLLYSNDTICRGEAVRLVKNPDSRLQYNWDPINTLDLTDPSNPIAKPNNTTTYSATITDGPCSKTQQITIYVRDKIKVSITGDTLICNGLVDLTAKSDSTTTFIWSVNPSFNPILFTGNHLISPITGTKTFYVKGGTADQCQDSASITLTDHSVKLNYKSDYSVCTGDTFQIQISNQNAADIIRILWKPDAVFLDSPNVLSPRIRILNPGRYVLYFTASNQFTCEFTDSIVINAVTPPIPDFNLENECGSLTIKVNTSTNGRIDWDFGDHIGSSHERSVSYTYTKAGKYIITLSVDTVCTRSLQKEFTVVFLSSSLEDTIISCFGEPVHINPNFNPDFHYEWTPVTGLDDPKSPNPLATVPTSTKYHVSISDPDFPGSCTIEDSILVFVPPILELSGDSDTTLCDKTTITLHASSNQPNTEFEWYDQSNRPIGKGDHIDVTPDKTSYYIVRATDRFGCERADTILVELFELNARLESSEIVCINDTTFIKIIAAAGTHYTYEWSPTGPIIGSNTDSIIYVHPDVTTTFIVKIRNEKNCSWELSKTIQVNNPQNNLSIKVDTSTIVPGQKTQLTATFNSAWKYLWKPQDGTLSDSSIYNPIASPIKTTTYTVTVTDETGCTAVASVTITVNSCEESVFIPNAFSPNNDHVNDTLYVRTRPGAVTKLELVIYSRWGERVFQTTDKNIGWDGKKDGDDLPPDVYGYGLKFTCHENKEYVRKGNISLLK